MTVNELISKLEEIEDKERIVVYSDYDGRSDVSITEVYSDRKRLDSSKIEEVELYFYR